MVLCALSGVSDGARRRVARIPLARIMAGSYPDFATIVRILDRISHHVSGRAGQIHERIEIGHSAMTKLATLLILLVSALFESGGDALVRAGLRSSSPLRPGFFVAGAGVLFAYGCLVNAPPWDFGRLIGVYITFFFVIAQLIGWLAFGETPNARMLLGGGCVVIGGLIMSSSK